MIMFNGSQIVANGSDRIRGQTTDHIIFDDWDVPMSTALSLYVTFPTRIALIAAWQERSVTYGSWQHLYFYGPLLYTIIGGQRTLLGIAACRGNARITILNNGATISESAWDVLHHVTMDWWRQGDDNETAIRISFSEDDFQMRGRDIFIGEQVLNQWRHNYRVAVSLSYSEYLYAVGDHDWDMAYEAASNILFSEISDADALMDFLGKSRIKFNRAFGRPQAAVKDQLDSFITNFDIKNPKCA